MELGVLTNGVDAMVMTEATNREISSIAYHTSQVVPGSLFVAVKGSAADGHDFVDQAVASGAVAVVASRDVPVPGGVAKVIVTDTRGALARISANWFNDPSRELRLIGVTGTNGKTTITYLLESIWKAAGRNAGVVGTVNIRYGGKTSPAPTTTPESLDLQGLFRAMRDNGVQDVVMEVSSHALDQARIGSCHFDGAIFTNLTQDHLDYHKNMESYAFAKRRLFAEVLPASEKRGAFAVVNADDQAGEGMVENCPARIVWYGLGDFGMRNAECGMENPHSALANPQSAIVSAADCRFSTSGIRMQIVTPDDRYAIESPLLGRFNASNILAVAAAAYAMGISSRDVQGGVARLACVPGRLEPVPNKTGVTVLVDYAHTPDALRNVLGALRDLKPARLITVFGCGGDRDHGKRPLMGAEVARKSDIAIVTSDNPRTENPMAIVSQITPGLKAAGWEENSSVGRAGKYRVIVDRHEAIHEALLLSRPGDIVLIAGKGHEDYQIIGTEKRHFDDREVVKQFFGA